MLTAAWRPLAIAAAAILLPVVIVVVSRTGLFDVRDMVVEGNNRLSRAAVVRLSGINPSTNAVWLDEGRVEERLEENDWIAQASVRVDLPWSVHVHVVERSPVAVVEAGSMRAVVAGDGTVLASARERRGLPTIQTPPGWIHAGSRVSFVGAARALVAMDPQVLAAVNRVRVTPMGTLEIVLRAGVKVAYGAARSFEGKAEAIGEVLAWADEQGERLRMISVSAPSAPAVALVP